MRMDTDMNREGLDEAPVWAWVAAGAVAVGAISAVIGCARACSRGGMERLMAVSPGTVDAPDITPPHGDKLDVRH